MSSDTRIVHFSEGTGYQFVLYYSGNLAYGRKGPRNWLCERREAYRAYSTARDSRITVTLIWPGYSSSFSISRAIS